METLITIASLAKKAIDIYFKIRKDELLSQISKQNEDIKKMLIYQYKQDKIRILQQAHKEILDFLNSSNSLAKKDYLKSAYEHYTSLCALPQVEVLPNGSSINYDDFISMGYYGRFICFGIKGDYKNSAIQVYDCATQLPHKAVKLFDISFFPKIDCSLLSELCDNLYRIKHYRPLVGLYKDIPPNMAKPLIELQIKKYKDNFKQISNSLKK